MVHDSNKTRTNPNQLAAHFFRHNYARMLAILVRYFGLNQVEIAEDLVQDTLVEAMEKWSIHSIPNNPEAWLMDVAKKKAINYLKRDQLFQNKILPDLALNLTKELDISLHQEKDSALKMIFTCCHPSLSSESQIALALKSLCGLSITEIANALLTTTATINKRLYRAKQKFRTQNILFEIPDEKSLSERLENVFYTLYLLFNEGYYSKHHEQIIRMDLCFEAIRLLKQLIGYFPDSSKAHALLAIMLLNVARFESRL
ncbi:MAG: sigma-70 family RNA polymerase sigma factor, partial [Bacteroidota bacterium]